MTPVLQHLRSHLGLFGDLSSERKFMVWFTDEYEKLSSTEDEITVLAMMFIKKHNIFKKLQNKLLDEINKFKYTVNLGGDSVSDVQLDCGVEIGLYTDITNSYETLHSSVLDLIYDPYINKNSCSRSESRAMYLHMNAFHPSYQSQWIEWDAEMQIIHDQFIEAGPDYTVESLSTMIFNTDIMGVQRKHIAQAIMNHMHITKCKCLAVPYSIIEGLIYE